MIMWRKRKELERRVSVLEDKEKLLDARCKDLFRMVLFVAKEARVLDPGLVERSMESLMK
jgi:hypothetical protein